MAYRFAFDAPLADEFRRIAGDQVDAALAKIDDPHLPTAKTVHEVRKHCKKLRGLLRLGRPALKKTFRCENAALRDAARLLSPVRDATVVAAAFDEFVEQSRELTAGVAPDELVALRAAVAGDANVADQATVQLAQFRPRLVDVRRRLEGWRLRGELPAAIATGCSGQYRAACRGLSAARRDATPEAWHQWRKEVKYLGYQIRLLEGLWPKGLALWSDAAATLGERLGRDHDLATLATRLCEIDPAGANHRLAAALAERAAAERFAAQAPTLRAGVQLLAFPPRTLKRWLQRLWP